MHSEPWISIAIQNQFDKMERNNISQNEQTTKVIRPVGREKHNFGKRKEEE
jgi:hypothetical protein